GDSAAPQPANNLSAWVPSGAPPTRFVLVRHGVTELSVARRFAGRSDLPLTERGVRQAEAAAARLAGLAGSVAAVLSSPLLRTRQTAERIAGRLELPVTVEDGLIETDYGAWDGHSFDEVRPRCRPVASRSRRSAGGSVRPVTGLSSATRAGPCCWSVTSRRSSCWCSPRSAPRCRRCTGCSWTRPRSP